MDSRDSGMKELEMTSTDKILSIIIEGNRGIAQSWKWSQEVFVSFFFFLNRGSKIRCLC